MDIFFIVVFFLYGLIFGSFFNVVGLRVPTKSLFSEKRSYCDTCQRTLSWRELIPVFSYLIQKGKCRGCHQRISLIYPLMEFATGILFASTYYFFGITNQMILGVLLISLIIPVSVSDIEYKRIPNRILIFFSPLFLIYRLFFPLNPFYMSGIGAVVAFILVLIIILISKGGMGVGDLKYFTLFGFIFGLYHFLLLFFLSTLFGSIGGLITMKINRLGRKSRIAFGPYIGLAALTVFFVGEPLIDWYISLF
ncbi:prepilin peptidase [Alkalibacterium pelagium]|uniref:Leader peptidase (Prepilin peptidase) / N-methyltransferase n=1 Tax=Alkalibacterium pelagium TaxID=426702 RepID=A0A1H7KTZ8_9LACT|nr:A24 family peptidase [Alkalibacterium pelagium]GEN50653.1 type 4 prepilin-like proteins leader peptide-processing enzyme [Alkalibacterium pelagium]SEK90343.1 leader peptidase (prepilin peptidase) / N-methyltransferase [Alkalibacterium pelagium]